MGLGRVPSLPFLLRQVRVGVVATGLTVAALGVSYFGLERAPFHRVGLAVVLVIAAAGGACIAALPWTASSVNFAMPQSVWWITRNSVPCGHPFSTGAPTSEPYSVHEPS
jgi:hypothetical protein